jgi:hypothetical protein
MFSGITIGAGTLALVMGGIAYLMIRKGKMGWGSAIVGILLGLSIGVAVPSALGIITPLGQAATNAVHSGGDAVSGISGK